MIVCKICSSEFEFSEGERQFYEGRSLNAPKRCPDCRAKKRREVKEDELARLKARVRELEKNNESILQGSE